MNLSKRYDQELEIKGYQADSAQLAAVVCLSELSRELYLFEKNSSGFRSKFIKPKPPSGVYFWGGVGRGKTFLMDLFYDEVKIVKKKRIHFHRFMKMIHEMLAAKSQIANPLDEIIREFSNDCLLLCLDEFFVSDIADAMILSNLLNACYREGVVIVTTSNIYPEGLYKNGLQRSRFVPAIKGICENFNVIELDGGSDYRLNTLKSSSLFFAPADKKAEKSIEAMFYRLVPDIKEVEKEGSIDILGRELKCIQACEDIIWMDFSELCEGPRSVSDYIELAKLYHAVLISGLPVLSASKDDAARRFVNLIDEFYDRGVKLIVTSESPISSIYVGTRLSFEFERTISRLLEMQGDDYLSKAHRPN